MTREGKMRQPTGALGLSALVATGIGIVLSQCTMVTVLQLTGSDPLPYRT